MTPSPSFNPFPGLRPFRESESHLFFGRSTHVDDVLAELARSRFVAVMGASGCGKSSLVAAGVLPMLHGGFSARAGSHWRIATFRPGGNPIHNLARALAAPDVLGSETADPLTATAQAEATLRRSGLGLADAARHSEQIGDGRLLVVVDQFEELFRFHAGADDRGIHPDGQRFVQLLVEATRDADSPVDVIITMRSDFLGDCAQFRDLPEAINEGLYLVPRLTRSQLREAFTAPAAVGGAVLSPRLVQRLLNDAGADPDMLPVMQHAMMRTWDTWVREAGAFGVIDVEHYEACGGAEAALSRHADEAYFELADDRRRSIAELMFKRVTELGDDRRETRRPTSLAEIAAVADATPTEVEDCITHFSEKGRSFLTVSADGIVDISHESLIRQWPRLTAWTQDEATSRDVYRRLADAADRWGRGEAALLHDPDLQIAAKWWTDTKPTQAWAERYDPEFERASQYLARSRRSARRRRAAMAAGVAALAILAVTAALLAVRASRARDEARAATADAQRERRTAVSRQLASESIAAGAASRTTSVLSALEAVNMTQPDGVRIPAAEEALRQALRDPLSVRLPSVSSQVGHTNPVRTVAFSPDGSLLATGGDDNTILLWSVDAVEAEPQLLPLSDGVGVLAFSPDGEWLAAGSDDGTARLWNVAAPDADPRSLTGHDDGISALAFSPDGSLLATAGRDERAILWSVEDPALRPQILTGHDGFVLSVAFSPDGRQIVTGGGDGVALVRAVDDPTAPPVRLVHGGDVTAVAFGGPDNRSVATASTDGTARLWGPDGAPGDVLAHRGPVTSLAFSPDGALLATGSEDSTARLWDLRAADGPAANPVIISHSDGVETVAFSQSGHVLATGSRDHTAQLLDLDHPDADPVVLSGHDGPIAAAAFGGDRWLATGSDDTTARLWDLDNLSTRPDVLPHASGADSGPTLRVMAIAFSPDGGQLATGASDKQVRIWDVADLTAPPVRIAHESVAPYEKAGITALAFSPDGGHLATGSGDRYVRLWDPADPTAPTAVSEQYEEAVTALAFDPDGRLLAVGINDPTAFVWDVSNPDSAALVPVDGHTDAVTSVAFSPDGETLAIGSRDGDVHLRRTTDLSAEPVVLEGPDDIISVAFSPDGSQLAAGSIDATVTVWDVVDDSATVAHVLEADALVSSVAFSPDGRTLLVSTGRTVQLWDLVAPDPANPIANPTVLRDHAATVEAVAYSPAGARFASGSADGTARVWLSLDELMDLGCDAAGRNFTRSEWDNLLPGEPYRSTCDEWPAGE